MAVDRRKEFTTLLIRLPPKDYQMQLYKKQNYIIYLS